MKLSSVIERAALSKQPEISSYNSQREQIEEVKYEIFFIYFNRQTIQKKKRTAYVCVYVKEQQAMQNKKKKKKENRNNRKTKMSECMCSKFLYT